jgi:hypothetical protein
VWLDIIPPTPADHLERFSSSRKGGLDKQFLEAHALFFDTLFADDALSGRFPDDPDGTMPVCRL